MKPTTRWSITTSQAVCMLQKPTRSQSCDHHICRIKYNTDRQLMNTYIYTHDQRVVYHHHNLWAQSFSLSPWPHATSSLPTQSTKWFNLDFGTIAFRLLSYALCKAKCLGWEKIKCASRWLDGHERIDTEVTSLLLNVSDIYNTRENTHTSYTSTMSLLSQLV